MKFPIGISNFPEKISSLSHSNVFFISLHWSLRKTFLSLLAILWNSAFKWVYLSFFSPLPFTFLFTAIRKTSSDSHFAFLHLFFLGIVLMPASCMMSQTFVHSSSGTLSIRSNTLNLFPTSTICGGGMDCEFGFSRYKLLYMEWINNKVLLYSTENYIQYPVINHNGKYTKMCVYVCNNNFAIIVKINM